MCPPGRATGLPRAVSMDSGLELQALLAVLVGLAPGAAETPAEPQGWVFLFQGERSAVELGWGPEPELWPFQSRLPSQKLPASLLHYIYDETSDRKLLNVNP